ncbi:YbhB/YbcL family Raf kinase inhibitor-like protein [Acidithiobacillus sp.]|uniref:YbhB/YbcL family Raf kinase inhibitor-like protein n=1 Tax=Acidithiobacillus sp. TaxID=1872118 RepID=UPI0025C39B36|nr:YbhB/YbcL family Raf kinase inhibitor-like protein [Acidithiobacillus sp.]
MAVEMKVFSTGIDPGDWIPQRFTQPGAGVTPPIFWQHLPPQTRSLVLLMEHREAKPEERIFWLVYDIPPTVEGIHEGGPLPDGAKLGRNSFGETRYRAPEASAERTLQHYDFVLLATDLDSLGLPAGADWDAVKQALRGHHPPEDLAPPPAIDARARELHPLSHVLDHAEFSGHFALDTDAPVKT